MATSDLDKQLLAASYGLTYAEIQAVPGLQALFNEAVKGSYTAEKFTALLKNTAWWRSTSDLERKFIDLRASDPATWQQQWTQNAFRLNQIAVAAGFGDLITGYGTDYNTMNGWLRSATWGAMSQGWSDDRVKSWFGASVPVKDGQPVGGEAGQVFDELHALSYANGREHSPDWYTWQVQSIMGGRTTKEAVEQNIRIETAAQYGAFKGQIMAGQNAMDLAAPYLKAASDLLELPSGALSLQDKNIQKAMTTQSKDGGAYSLWQLQNDVRQDVRWKQTNNAREDAMSTAHQVLTSFGLTY